jgi:hypothetical protein
VARAYERDLESEMLNQGPEPEEFITCDQCGGEGHQLRTVWVYEHGCGVPHEDVEAVKCDVCNGAGGFLCPALSSQGGGSGNG